MTAEPGLNVSRQLAEPRERPSPKRPGRPQATSSPNRAGGRHWQRSLADACPDGVRHVIHGDSTAGNLLVVDGAVSAVLDWGNSLVGDPLYDLAWLVFWSPWHPGLDVDVIVSEVRRRCTETGVDVENFDERLRCCQLHIALDSMAYKAFRRDDMNLNGTIDRLLPLLDAPIEKDRTV